MPPGRKHKSSLGPTTKVLSQPRRDIVGCRIQHVWKEGGGHVVWKGTVLDQVSREGQVMSEKVREGLMKPIGLFRQAQQLYRLVFQIWVL